MAQKIKAVVLASGGLDSILALKMMVEQGIEVVGVNFDTGFFVADHRRNVPHRKSAEKSSHDEVLQAESQTGVPIKIVDVSQEYLREVLLKPKYGYGSAMNPCIDCRIFMLKNAKRYMEQIGAQFIVTGEVLGQRPMTQHFKTLRLIEKQSNLDRLILRPLSAKLLPLTIPEEKGWVNREKLAGISGRSRQEQFKLAKKFALHDYPQPANGPCYLTDRNYARRLRDLFTHRPPDDINQEDVVLLKAGRHFRLSDQVKVIVGRNEVENHFLERYVKGRWTFEARDFVGPLTLAEGQICETDILLIAQITARYCDGKDQDEVYVVYRHNEQQGEIKVVPATEKDLACWRL